MGEHVALKMHHAPLPIHPRQLARYRCLYPLVVVRDHQAHPAESPVQESPRSSEAYAAPFFEPAASTPRNLPKTLLVHSYARQQRHARNARAPPNLQQVGRVQVENRGSLSLPGIARATPFAPLGGVGRGGSRRPCPLSPYTQRLGDPGDLTHGDAREVHLSSTASSTASSTLPVMRLYRSSKTSVTNYSPSRSRGTSKCSILPAGSRGWACVVAVALSSPGVGVSSR